MRALLFILLLAPLAAFGAPPCWPAQVTGGTGTPAVWKVDSACYGYGWTCPAQDKLYIVAGPRSAFTGAWREIGLELMTGTEAERTAAVAKYLTAPSIPSACAPLATRVRTQLVAAVPAPDVYKVKANVQRIDGARPTAILGADGVIRTSTGRYVAAGTACDCAKVSAPSAGTDRWCWVGPDLREIALCAKQ